MVIEKKVDRLYEVDDEIVAVIDGKKFYISLDVVKTYMGDHIRLYIRKHNYAFENIVVKDINFDFDEKVIEIEVDEYYEGSKFFGEPR